MWHADIGALNELHWVLDVALQEDHSRIRKDHAPENLPYSGIWLSAGKCHPVAKFFIVGAEGLQEGLRFRDDVKAEFVVLEIPGRAGRPGGVFVVPVAFCALEIVIAQPLDTRRKIGGRFDGKTGLVKHGCDHGRSPFR